MPPVVLPWDHITSIIVAAFLSAMIGVERDLNGRPAGLRTSMMVGIGSCLFTILSAYGFAKAPGTQDATRIASQIVIGVGFLGTGVLIKGDHEITGLTTAANIWLVAAIGMAVGTGMTFLAVFVTIFAVLVLTFLRPLSRKLDRIGDARIKRMGGKPVHED